MRSAKDAVLSAIDGISDPEAHVVPAPGEWMVSQILAHVAEVQTFWIARAILITEENDPGITRSAVENDQRIAAVTDHSQDSLNDLKRNVIAASETAVTTVGRIDPKDLDRPGHREANPMTAGGVIKYVAAHERDHADQINEARRLIKEKR